MGAESNAAMYTVVEGYPYLVALQNKIKTSFEGVPIYDSMQMASGEASAMTFAAFIEKLPGGSRLPVFLLE